MTRQLLQTISWVTVAGVLISYTTDGVCERLSCAELTTKCLAKMAEAVEAQKKLGYAGGLEVPFTVWIGATILKVEGEKIRNSVCEVYDNPPGTGIAHMATSTCQKSWKENKSTSEVCNDSTVAHNSVKGGCI